VPYVRDDRETPLCVGRDGEGYAGDLGQMGTGIFLQEGLDRWNHAETKKDFSSVIPGREPLRASPE
jgi:hypothetical protein